MGRSAATKVPFTESLFQSGRALEDALNSAPTPKPSAQDKAAFGRLASLYTAYSAEFAAYALDACLRAGYSKIADPFSGMGTLADSGRTRPIRLQLSDISPFAVLSGAFRSARRADIERGVAKLMGFSSRLAAKDERGFFEQMFSAVQHETGESIAAIISSPSRARHRTAALVIYLAALTRIRLHRRLEGSNPTWVKRASRSADIDSTRRAVVATMSAVRTFADQLPSLHPRNHTSSTWASINSLSIETDSLDAIITSPPYANRTDYIRHYLPASELLLQASVRDERALRSEQIGTPLIRDAYVDRPLPTSIVNLLEQIRTHSSYASERYYYKGFRYYFTDMYDALTRLRTWLRPGGILLLVVQDTYYKDVHVRTPDLLGDLARHIGFGPVARRDWRVRHSLSQLSPHSRRVMPNRSLSESVITLSR